MKVYISYLRSLRPAQSSIIVKLYSQKYVLIVPLTANSHNTGAGLCVTPSIQISIIHIQYSCIISVSTFMKLDFLFSSLFIAIFPARNCKISWQISWHLLYLYLAFRSFPTEYWFNFCTISKGICGLKGVS